MKLQSLFFWQLYCNDKFELKGYWNEKEGYVTILVFLAALLQPDTSRVYGCGNYSVTILVFLAALLQRKISSIERIKRVCKLQSLFFWQLYCNSSSSFPIAETG